MEAIDLTHVITESMPVYPDTLPPSLKPANTLEENGFRETLLSMFSHTGTHMDAPAHIFEDGKCLDEYPIGFFTGKAVVIDCRDLGEGDRISRERIERYGEAVREADFILFNTGWDRFWGKPEYFGDYPCLDWDAVECIQECNPHGIGFDTIGIDPIADEKLTIHHALLSQGMVFIENLTNLEKVGESPFTLFALPLKWEKADGAPIRAIAIR